MWTWLFLAYCAAPPDDANPPDPDPPEPPVPTEAPVPQAPASPVRLTVPPADDAPFSLDLSRDEVQALLGPIADELVLLELDPDVLLGGALAQIRAACGDDWTDPEAEPVYDCTTTALGATFGPDWATTPEFAMVRLLTMTPGNARMTGTSLETIADLADALGVGGGFGPVLADALQRDVDALAVADPALVDALREGLLATHPQTTSEGAIPITLEDVLTDLESLAGRLGPALDHPGIVDPGAPPFGRVIDDDFAMRLDVESNLVVADGIDCSEGKGYLVASTDDVPATIDFLDPERFALQGLVDGPTVDFRLALNEAPTFAGACLSSSTCWDNGPGQPVNPDSVWAMPAWSLESVIADAARREHQGRDYEQTYFIFLVVPAVTLRMGDGDAPGAWLSFDVLFDLGDPPEEQYLWELLLEVAQVNLHAFDTYSFTEGDANPRYSLTGIPTGISADQIEARVRAALDDQSDRIGEALFGDYREGSDPVDFVFLRDSEGRPALQFVAPRDRTAEALPTHDVVGFFADAALTERVSIPLGGREVWYPPAGDRTIYVQDDRGVRFQLDVHADQTGAESIEIVLREVP